MNNPGDRPSQAPARQEASGEWHLETGVYSRDVDTQRLKKLELHDLSIAETARYPRPPGLTDPNGNSSTASGKIDNDPNNSAGRGALKADASGMASPAPRKPLDSKKLEEWVALRKRVDPNNRDGG